MEDTYVDDIPERAEDGAVPAWVSEDGIGIVEERAIPDSTALTVMPQQQPRSVLDMLSHAGMVAWRQPAVRAAVRTGASAVALSVALRVAGRLVTSRGARRIATQAALPGMLDLLDPDERQTSRRGHGVEVSETFIYVRRIARR